MVVMEIGAGLSIDGMSPERAVQERPGMRVLATPLEVRRRRLENSIAFYSRPLEANPPTEISKQAIDANGRLLDLLLREQVSVETEICYAETA